MKPEGVPASLQRRGESWTKLYRRKARARTARNLISMSGVPLFARVGAALESRLSLSPSSSCRDQTRRKSTSECVDNRDRRVGKFTTNSYRPHSRTTRFICLPAQTSLHECGRGSIANRVSTRCSSSTSIYTPEASVQYVPIQPVPDIGFSVVGDAISDGPRNFRRQDYYQILLQEALRHKRPADILKSIIAVSPEYLHAIPNNTFSQIIHLIQPQKTVGWAKTIHDTFSPKLVKQTEITPPDHIIEDYLRIILEAVTNRKRTGKRLNVNDYAILLKIAGAIGSKRVAKAFWNSMQTENIAPDMRCYNAYLEAIVHNAGNYSETMHRIIPLTVRARSTMRLGADFVAYRFGEGGIREETLFLLDQILKGEQMPDAETLSLVIIGVAREGDLDTVKGILKNVWHIDVAALLQDDGVIQNLPRNHLTPNSPLYPTKQVIFAIAHAFLVNNDVPAALRVVDAVSLTFNLPIIKETWAELFRYTWEMTRLRHYRLDSPIGRLPKDSVQKLWKTMTDEPYNVKPSMDMYDIMIKSCEYQWKTQDMWFYMQRGLRSYIQSYKSAQQARASLEKAMLQQKSNRQINVQRRRTEFALAELLRKRNRVHVGSWLRLLLASMKRWHMWDSELMWSTRRIPSILDEWSAFAPRIVTYEIPGGLVRIKFRERGEIIRSHHKRAQSMGDKEELINASPSPPGSIVQLGIMVPRKLRDREEKVARAIQRQAGGREGGDQHT
ncbi:mitochondrial ATPase expression-domain-containing protein [Delphinella strobiligena]|nr:mitochondrial ATPase expression-domain-containing protein [Delphinella strobiligena]